jgi:hypothetical protein
MKNIGLVFIDELSKYINHSINEHEDVEIIYIECDLYKLAGKKWKLNLPPTLKYIILDIKLYNHFVSKEDVVDYIKNIDNYVKIPFGCEKIITITDGYKKAINNFGKVNFKVNRFYSKLNAYKCYTDLIVAQIN